MLETLLRPLASTFLLMLCACASLPERVSEVIPGMTEWQVREEFGQPDLIKDLPPVDRIWVYISGDTACDFHLREQRVLDTPACRDHNGWTAHHEAESLAAEAAAAEAALRAEKEAAVAKAADLPKHPMPPVQPVPGFH